MQTAVRRFNMPPPSSNPDPTKDVSGKTTTKLTILMPGLSNRRFGGVKFGKDGCGY